MLRVMHSMTGFGRGTAATSEWHASVEISAVNRKQTEVVVQAARELAELEGRIRKLVLGVVSRGRIQVAINLERAQGATAAIRVDATLACHSLVAAVPRPNPVIECMTRSIIAAPVNAKNALTRNKDGIASP